MQFTVRDWMIDLVVYVDPESTVTDALALMRRRYLHSLIVQTSEKHPELGIITSTDICDKIIAQGRNPSKTLVGDIMTSPLITVNQDDTLQDCSKVMMKNRIHHIPVVDKDDRLVGMISATDFLVAAEAMGRAPGERIT